MRNVAKELLVWLTATIIAFIVVFGSLELWARSMGETLFQPAAIAQMAQPERPWWDLSWLWNHERSRFKVSRIDIRTAVKG